MIGNLSVFGLTAAPGGVQAYSGIIMIVAMFAVFYFILIRPQKKKDKEIKSMRESLSVGDEVITIGGIHGKVAKISDETIILELNHGKQRITFSKWAVGSVDKKGKESNGKDAAETEAIEEKTSQDTKTDDKQ